MRTCDVSVIIPNYNRTTSLRRAIMSVAMQTLLPKEVIVIDDCSNEEAFNYTQKLLLDFFNELSIRIIRIDQNRGANHCRNRGISSAYSKYLAFLDSDDIWMPEKLEKQMALIEQAKSYDTRPILSGTGRYRVTGQGEIVARQYGGSILNPLRIRASNFIGTLSSVVVETNIARKINGFDEVMPACQDWEFFIRLADYVQYVGLPDPLCIYVEHSEERITSGNRKRLWALFSIYRQYIKNDPTGRDESGVFRIIAEDLQELGRYRSSRNFYKKYLLTKHCGGLLSDILGGVLAELHYRLPFESIKERRYREYRRTLARRMRDPCFRHEVSLHQNWITRVIHDEFNDGLRLL